MDKDELIQRLSSADFVAGIKAILHQGACSETTEWDVPLHDAKQLQLFQSAAASVPAQPYPVHLCFISSGLRLRPISLSKIQAHENPLNVYGYSKLQFDRYVRRVAGHPSSQVVGLRYFNVYGPRERHKGSMASVAFHFHNQLREHGEARLFEGSGGYDDGEQLRDFVYVDDVNAVNLWFLEHPDASGIFNCGTGQAQSFNDVANAVIKHRGKGRIRYVPFPEHLKGAYQSFTQADLTALRASGCDVEFRKVEAGVKRYLDAISS